MIIDISFQDRGHRPKDISWVPGATFVDHLREADMKPIATCANIRLRLHCLPSSNLTKMPEPSCPTLTFLFPIASSPHSAAGTIALSSLQTNPDGTRWAKVANSCQMC